MDERRMRALFEKFDADGDGSISPQEFQQILRDCEMASSAADAALLVAQADRNGDGRIEFSEFAAMMRDNSKLAHKVGKLTAFTGAVGQHSYSSEEMQAFTEVINSRLGEDARLSAYLPIDNAEGSSDLFEKCADGVVLCRLINLVDADAVDERAVNFKKLSKFKIIENNNLAINAAKGIGCRITNIGAHDVMEARPHLILGLLWQIIRLLLTMKISIREYPEMARLLNENETLAQLLALPPERILVRWVNYHLAAAKSDRRINALGKELSDSVVYDTLMRQLYGNKLPHSPSGDLEQRASAVLANAESRGVSPFIKARDVASGNAKLNLAFTAQLFNDCHGLKPLDAEEEDLTKELAELDLDDAGDTREARTFKLWVNSLNLSDPTSADETLQINDLFNELCNGLPILSVMDHIEQGIVPWKKVRKEPKNRHHVVENGNHVVAVGKKMDLVLVNIGGLDIADGNKKLILAVMWQLMRRSTIDLLASLKGGEKVEEAEIIAWANRKVTSGKSIRTLGDKSLSTSLFLIDLCEAISPGTVNWDLVTPGKSSDDALLNARYVLSIAKKIGAGVFCTPEDITEVRPKMILLFIAAIWQVDMETTTQEPSRQPNTKVAPPPPAPAKPSKAPAKQWPPVGGGPSSSKPAPAPAKKWPPVGSGEKPAPAPAKKWPPVGCTESKPPPPVATSKPPPPSRPVPVAEPSRPPPPVPRSSGAAPPTRAPPPVPQDARKPLPPPPGGSSSAAPPPTRAPPPVPQRKPLPPGAPDTSFSFAPPKTTAAPSRPPPQAPDYSWKSVNGTGETGPVDSNDVDEEEWN